MAVSTAQNPRLAGGSLSASDPAVDADSYTTGSTTVLATTARGFIPNATGTLTVDLAGGIDGRPASTNVGINVLSGFQYFICFTKIYGTSPSGVILY